MKCQNCGKEINGDFQFCPHCGATIEPAENQQITTSDQSFQTGAYNYNADDAKNSAPIKERNGVISVLALVFGIIGLLTSCIIIGIVPAIIGIIFGIIGLATQNRKGICIAGIVCGGIGVLVFAIMIFVFSDSSSDLEESTQIVSEAESEVETEIKEANNEDATEKATEDVVETEKKEETPEKKKSEKAVRKEFINSCEELDYKKVARNPDKYVGKNFKVNVQISSISEGGWLSESYMKAYTADEYGYYFDKLIYIFDDQDKDSKYYINVLEDDIITVYGTFEGMEDTKNHLNGETSKDLALHMKYAKLISE